MTSTTHNSQWQDDWTAAPAKATALFCLINLGLLSGLICSVQAQSWSPSQDEGWEDKTPSSTPTPLPKGAISAPHDINGVNRRVEVKGRGAVTGQFSDPTWTLNQKTVGTYGNWKGKKANFPNLYVGIRSGSDSVGGATSMEGGLIWKPEAVNQNTGLWRPFFRGSVSYNGKFYHRWFEPVAYTNATYQSLDDTTMQLVPTKSGKVSLSVKNDKINHTFPALTGLWPKTGSNIDVSRIWVRRVIALTQAQGNRIAGRTNGIESGPVSNHRTLLWVDGSHMENLHFSGGYVAPLRSSSTLSVGGWQKWPARSGGARSPDQHAVETGTSPNNINNVLPETRQSPNSPWIVDFPDSARSTAEPGNYVAGYDTEKVVIDLRRNKTVKAKPVTGKASTPGFIEQAYDWVKDVLVP